jgi:hypothetical protein
MLIGLVVVGVAFTLYRANASFYLNSEAALQVNHNLRQALSVLSRDVRMAGNGLEVLGSKVQSVQLYGPTKHDLDAQGLKITRTAGWFKHPDAATSQMGLLGVYGTDGGANGSDSITVFRSEVENPLPVAEVASFSNGSFALSSPLAADAVRPGDVMAAVNSSAAFIFEVASVPAALTSLQLKRHGRFTFDGPPTGFPTAGSFLYNLRDVSVVTYFVDESTHRLMADYHDRTRTVFDDPAKGAVTVAEDIEDLQIYYFFANDSLKLENVVNNPALSYDRFAAERVKAAAVAVTSRSVVRLNRGRFNRPALFNRVAGSAVDQRRRATLMEVAYLRNFSDD